jgi:predicted Zn-dependent protease
MPDTLMSLDDAPAAIAHGLWLMTDLAYKQAVASHLKVKGDMVFRTEKRERPSFSPAPAVHVLQDRTTLELDGLRWAEEIRSLGRLLGSMVRIEDHAIHIDASRITRWLVNSEGSRLRTEKILYAISVLAYSRAADGALLSHSFDAFASTEASLPTSDALLEATARMATDLVAVADAPALEPCTVPAILESKAAGVFFHEVLGHRLEGHRQDRDDEGQTFSDHLGRTILPTFLSVVDDPTLAELSGTSLNGSYAFDDEGVAAQRVTLVEAGRLKGFLMARRPVKGFPGSNGHGRAQGTQKPVARMANLRVDTTQSVSAAELKALLLAEVRRQGRPFGIIVRDLAGGTTNTSSFGYQAFKGEARVVVRVDARTGEETLVRGVDLVGTPLTSLGQIMAVGDTREVFNGYCGAESGMVPVSSVAPAILIRSLELQRSTTERSRAPVLDAPHRLRSSAP